MESIEFLLWSFPFLLQGRCACRSNPEDFVLIVDPWLVFCSWRGLNSRFFSCFLFSVLCRLESMLKKSWKAEGRKAASFVLRDWEYESRVMEIIAGDGRNKSARDCQRVELTRIIHPPQHCDCNHDWMMCGQWPSQAVQSKILEVKHIDMKLELGVGSVRQYMPCQAWGEEKGACYSWGGYA